MQKHGSGELLRASARGCSARAAGAVPRWPPPAEASCAAVPLLADGAERHQAPARRPAPQEARRADDLGRREAFSHIPSGFTYLGQFIDHDLTFDKTNVMFGQNVAARAAARRLARPASTSTRSTARARAIPDRPTFYEADGLHLKIGTTAAADGDPGEGRLRPAPRRGHDREGQADGDHPRPAERREPRGRADAPAPSSASTTASSTRCPTRCPSRSASRGRARSSRTTTSGCSARTSCRASADRASSTTCSPTAGRCSRSARTPTDIPTMPIEFSVAAYRLGHSMVRDGYNWNKIFDDGSGTLELLFTFSGTERRPRRRQAAAQHLDRRLPPAVRLRRSRASRPRRARTQVQPGEAHRHALSNPLSTCRRDVRRPGSRAATERNLAFRNLTRARMVRLATGQQMADVHEVEGRDAHAADEGADPRRRQQRRHARRADDRAAEPPAEGHAAVVLHPSRGRAQRRQAARRRRAASSPRRSIGRWRAARPRRSCATPPGARRSARTSTTFRMVDLLLFAFEGKKTLLAPLG